MRSHSSASDAAAAVSCSGSGDVDLQHLGRLRELARRAPGEREATAGPAQHDVGAFLLGEPGDGEGQRSIGEHAGDQDAFPVEQSHAPGQVTVMPLRVDRTNRVCKGSAMPIGILGGTGPAGRGLAVRLAAAGEEVVIGSRDAERAEGVAGELVDALARPPSAAVGSRQRLGGRGRPGRRRPLPGTRPVHGPDPRHRRWPATWWCPWPSR